MAQAFTLSVGTIGIHPYPRCVRSSVFTTDGPTVEHSFLPSAASPQESPKVGRQRPQQREGSKTSEAILPRENRRGSEGECESQEENFCLLKNNDGRPMSER